MKKKIGIFFLILIVLFGVQLYIDNNVIEITSYEVVSSELPKNFDGLKILQLSDLHSKEFGENNYKLLDMVIEIDPDIIMMTGDMVSAGETDYSIFLNFAKIIGPKYETYYIIGNHEMDLTNSQRKFIEDELESYGIDTLDNEKVVLTKNGENINLYGMWYNIKYYTAEQLHKTYEKTNYIGFTEKTIENIIGEDNDDTYDILLTHNPKYFEEYSKWGAELTLSGHVHGGMIRLPFVGALVSPDRTFFPKYSEGIYENGDSKMVVSRGLGRGLTGFRLFNRPELVVITLKSK